MGSTISSRFRHAAIGDIAEKRSSGRALAAHAARDGAE
jgi:hypothetical protein